MSGVNWLRDCWRDVVPGPSPLSWSVFMHLAMLAGVVALLHLFRPATFVHLAPAKVQKIQTTAGNVYLSSKSKTTTQHSRATHLPPRTARMRLAQTVFLSSGVASPGLREEAQKQTTAITNSIKFKWMYGFYPGADYKLAVQRSGEIPVISADQLPAHYQQYVIVEVTIDTEGQVAEARVVSGMVDPSIQQTLLSAIREFRYTPATRDGVPIPSQRDIVVHVPS